MKVNYTPLLGAEPTLIQTILATRSANIIKYVLVLLLAISITPFFPTMLALVFALLVGHKSKQIFLWRRNTIAFFAAVNGFRFTANGAGIAPTFYFDHDYDSFIRNQVSFKVNGRKSRVFTYGYGRIPANMRTALTDRYMTLDQIFRFLPTQRLKHGAADSLRQYHHHNYDKAFTKAIVFETIIPVTIPHMFIDSQQDNTLFARKVDRRHKLSLEGVEFNKRYSLYIAKEFHVEALDIVNPVFMAALLDQKQRFDLEIIGNRLLIYVDTDQRSHKEYAVAIKAGIAVLDSLEATFERWRFNQGKRTTDFIEQK